MQAVTAARAAFICLGPLLLVTLLLVTGAHADALDDCNRAADLDRRIKGCTSLIGKKIDKKNLALVYAQRGDAYARNKQDDLALADFTKCTELAPRDDICWAMKAALHDQKFQFEEALAAYTAYLKLIPSDPKRCNALLQRADAYHRSGFWGSVFDAVKNRDGKELPKDAPSPELTPEQQKARNDTLTKAVADLDECILLDPLRDDAFFKRGMYLNQLGRHDEGFADYQKAYDLNPNNKDALAFLSTSAFNRGDYARSLELAGKWMKLAPNDLSIEEHYAESLAKLGRTAEAGKMKALIAAKRDCSKGYDLSKLEASAYDAVIAGCTGIIDSPDADKDWRRLGYELRANLYGVKRKLAEAVDDYTHALELTDEPKSRAIYLENRGVNLVNLGKQEAAVKDFDEVLKIAPGSARALEVRGYAYFQTGNMAKAEEDLKRAVAIKPANQYAQATLGDIAFKRGDFDAAAGLYSRAIEVNAKYAVAYQQRGLSYEKLGRKDEAMADLRKAIELDPALADATGALGRIGLGSLPSGVADQKKRCDAALNTVYDGKETNLDDGIADCTAVIDAAGIDQASLVAALEGRAELASRKQKFDTAVADYTRCLELVGGENRDGYFYQQRAYNLISLGQHERAVADLNLRLKRKPDAAQSLELRGYAYVQLGQYDKAKADFASVVALEPQNRNAIVGLGDAERLTHNCNAAVAQYGKVIQLTPDDGGGYLLRGLCFEELGRKDEAVADFRKTLAIVPEQPDSIEALKRLGVAP